MIAGRIRPVSAHPGERPPLPDIDEIKRNWRYAGGECAYAGSGGMYPSYSLLDDRQTEYYFYWRSKVFEGIFPDTDHGYIWLHVQELLRVDDPSENMECLEGMRRAYRGQDENVDKLLDEACGFYSVITGFPPGDAPYFDGRMRAVRICKILSENGMCLSKNDMKYLTGKRSKAMEKHGGAAG